MPAQVGKSAFLTKMGARFDRAIRDHAKDETDFGFQQLPEFQDGVARLTDLSFEEYKPGSNAKKADGSSAVGEYFFRASGTIVRPRVVRDVNGNEVSLENRTISVFINLFDTKKGDGSIVTEADHVAEVLNELRKLGADTSKLQGLAGVDAIITTLKRQAPYFRCENRYSKEDPGRINPATGKPYPPRGFPRFNGVLPDFVDDGDEDDVKDGGAPTPRSSPNGTHKPIRKDPVEPVVEYSDAEDMDSLVERANQDDEDAQARLKEIAMAAGHSEDACNATTTWEGLRDLAGQEPEAEGEEAGEWEPEKGGVYPVKLETWDPVKKKVVRATKAVNCEVLAVDNVAKTVTLKNLVTKKTHTGKDGKPQRVSWDELIRG